MCCLYQFHKQFSVFWHLFSLNITFCFSLYIQISIFLMEYSKKAFVHFEQQFFSFIFTWCQPFLWLFKNYLNCSFCLSCWLRIRQWHFSHIDTKMNDQICDHYFDRSFARLLFTQFWRILLHTSLKPKIGTYETVFVFLTHLSIYFVLNVTKYLSVHCFFFEWYLNFKLNLFNSKIHYTWSSLSFFIVKKYSRFLWSIINFNFYKILVRKSIFLNID